MNKNIKDYLHLYLGSEYIIEYSYVKKRKTQINKISYGSYYTIIKRCDAGFSTVKLILRPLSDMTDEERNELKLNVVQGSLLENPYEIMWTPEQVRVLLSKHFDLFNLH